MTYLRSFCLLVLVVIIVSSCKKDEAALSQLTINGTKYTLSSGFYTKETSVNSVGTDITIHHVLLTGPEVIFNETTGLFEGTSNVLSFTIITETSDVIPSDIYGVRPGDDIPRVVTYAAALLNYDAASETAETTYEISDGIIDVSFSGGVKYGFNVDLTYIDANSNETTITGLFKGSLVVN